MSTISELFDKDPLSLSTQDLDLIIAYYREKRAAFALGDKAAGATKKMKADGPKIGEIDLDALGLGGK